MAGPVWRKEEEAYLKELVGQPISYMEIADRFVKRYPGRTRTAIRQKITANGWNRYGTQAPWTDLEVRDANILTWREFSEKYPTRPHASYVDHRQSFRRQLESKAEITDYRRHITHIEGDVAVAACVHVPQTDPQMWARFLAIIERDKIDQVVIAGDIVTGDMFSHWDIKEDWDFDEELESLRLHLKSLLCVTREVYITPGNHVTNRIVKITNGHVRLHHLIAAAGLSEQESNRVFTTDVDYLSLKSGSEQFLIAHASNYSKIGGRVPTWYAEKYGCHVVTGNGHQLGWQVSTSGKYHGIDIGTMANPSFMGYTMQSLTTYPYMMQTFLTIRSGAVRIYGSGLPVTDWKAELS